MKHLIFCLFAMMALPALAQPDHIIIVKNIPAHVKKPNNADANNDRKDLSLSFPVLASMLNTENGNVENCHIDFPTITENTEKIQIRFTNIKCNIEFENNYPIDLVTGFTKVPDLWTYPIPDFEFQQKSFMKYDPDANVWVFDKKNGIMHFCHLEESLDSVNEAACIVRIKKFSTPEIIFKPDDFFGIESFCGRNRSKYEKICNSIDEYTNIPDVPEFFDVQNK